MGEDFFDLNEKALDQMGVIATRHQAVLDAIARMLADVSVTEGDGLCFVLGGS